MNVQKFYIHILMILAIVTVGISPACAFISGGSSFIQICAADGSVQTIEVDGAFDPFAQLVDESAPISTEHLEAMEKCSFCFASTHQKYGMVENLTVHAGLSSRYLRVGAGSFVPVSMAVNAFQARGPPQLS